MGVGTIRLCYGVHYDIETWRQALGIPAVDGMNKTCPFCHRTCPDTDNFCGNCGKNIEGVGSVLTIAEIVDITYTTGGEPPVPIRIMANEETVCICQVLAESKKGMLADFSRSPKMFQWEQIGNLVSAYVNAAGLPTASPHIFALWEEKREKDAK